MENILTIMPMCRLGRNCSWVQVRRQRTDKKWLIDFFVRHINISRVILCLEVRKSRSLCVYMCISVLLFSTRVLFAKPNRIRITLKHIYLTHICNSDQELPLWIRVDLGVIAMRGYPTLLRSSDCKTVLIGINNNLELSKVIISNSLNFTLLLSPELQSHSQMMTLSVIPSVIH